MSLRVAIFEPEADGHHMVYFEHIARELLRRGHKVALVTTERTTSHPAYISAKERLRNFETVLMPDTRTPDEASDLRRIQDQFKRRRDFQIGYQTLLATMVPDVCFMMNLDRADLPLSIAGSPFGKTPFSGFLMGRQFHSPSVGVKIQGLRRRDKIAEPVFLRMLRLHTLKKILSVDETLVTYAQQMHPRGWQKVCAVPDAAYIDLNAFKGDAREYLGLRKEDHVLLAYGSLSLRKGIAELISALSEPEATATTLMLAGKQDEEVRQLLTQQPATELRTSGRLVERDQFIDSKTESALFQAADAVWVGYRHWYGMSGVLVQASAAAKPVISMDEGLIGYLVETHRLGIAVPISDPQSVARAVGQLRTRGGEFAADGLKFAEGRTPESFASQTCDLIESSV